MATSDSTAIQLPLAIDSLTVQIPLTKGYVAIVDAVDADLVQFNWSARPCRYTVYAQRAVRANGKSHMISLHCAILERILGRPLSKTEKTDHWDGNGLNNRRSNLRLATHSQNVANQRTPKTNTSGYKGVSWYKRNKKWGAYITREGKRRFLGLFDTPQAAHEAYKTAALELFGEFARFE